MTRVIHTGDTHLGYRQYHVAERREDFLAAFRQVAEDAVADDVDAVVHAGDLFHDRRPTLPDIMGALDVLRTLADADVPFLAVVGNHETKREAQWLDLFENLGYATRLGAEAVEVADVAFYGLDFVPRTSRDELEPAFEATDANHRVLVTHGLFEPFDLGEWDVRDLLDASPVEFDAVLLGDNHDPGTKQVTEPTETWVTYCGSTERASADEREERGYNLVVFEDDVDVRRRGLDTRGFVFVDLDLGPGEGVERVRERVGQHDLEDVVVIVSIDGDGEPVTPAAVEEFALDRGALVARVTDHREFADEEAVDVSFADPDAAVRERVRDLGLSEAARDIDEVVRASKIADSNVDDAVEERVRELVEAGERDVFEAGGSEGALEDGEDDGEASADPAAAEEDGAARTGATDDMSTVSPDEAGARTTDKPNEDGDTPADGEEPVEPESAEGASPDDGDRSAADAGGDGQATMEEYR
jgi:DNA repair exonuclease SbcCD nuclease subunit